MKECQNHRFDQQNNNRDCGLFSIANALGLAFEGDPGTVRDVSTDRRCFPVYIALRYLYGPVKLDCFSYYQCVFSWFYQWYQWYTDVVQGSTNGTIGNTIGTNGNANGTIGAPNGTIGIIGKPMVPFSTNYQWYHR